MTMQNVGAGLAPRIQPQAATADVGFQAVQGFREGSMSFTDFYNRMAAAGRVFLANFGTVATQLTFLAQAANRPDFWIRVPSGTCVIPLFCHVALGAQAGTVTTMSLRHCQNDIGNGTSSAASVGPLSCRTDAPVASQVTARQLATGDTTAETNPVEEWKHVTITASAAGNDMLANATVERWMMGNPYLIGPATWEGFIWATTTQATGYAIMGWIETPANWWT